MSAIAGIVYFNGAPIEPGLIESLTDAMSARGPDGQSHWVRESVALGHCMLRATPESLEEHQPLTGPDDVAKHVLVWDGRLDNREELSRALSADGAALRDNSDAELALQSYIVWGEECPRHLLGDFTFAVWDPAQRCLFCARDHMGARPFYYARNERFFAFASEQEALAVLPGVSSRPNEERMAYFLFQSFVSFEHSRSWLEDVWILPAASWMTIALNGEVQSKSYWQLEPGEELAFASDEACREAFLGVFGEAVRCRVRSSGHVAAMMSGGLDSAGIAAMVKRLVPGMPGKEFHTYSAISDHPETCVESQCIQDLTADLGDNAHFVSVPSFSGMLSAKDVIDVGWSRAHPCDNSILLPAMMCLAASRNGHRVMLHGVSGDLTLRAPHRYIAPLLLAGRWRQGWHECRSASCNHTYLRGTSPVLLLLQNVWTAYAPRAFKVLRRRLLRKDAASLVATSLINRDLAEKFRIVERMGAHQRDEALTSTAPQQEQIRALLPPHGIELGITGYDKVGGRYGVELRDPWADRRVVEFCLRLPLDQRVRDGWTKFVVRTAFGSDLSPRVRDRVGKEHLGWNFANRLMNETHGFVAETMARSVHPLAGYVDTAAVQRLYARYRETKRVGDCEQLHDVVTAALWLERCAHAESPHHARLAAPQTA
jgi:asparagine synthase (glutamine-hydrolysing)